MIRERKHRLPEAAYVGRKTVLFTACTQHRSPFLADLATFEAFRDAVQRSITKADCICPIFCVMPDHLHLLLLGLSDTSRPKLAMDEFKVEAGHWLMQYRPGCLLQKDYHDRIVRRSEGFLAAARYIALNPVRKGLSQDINEWPFTASVGCDRDEVFQDAFWE